MPEHKIQLVFKGKPEYLAKVNILNRAYVNQHIHTEIPYGSRSHVIVPDTVQITFILTLSQGTKYTVLFWLTLSV